MTKLLVCVFAVFIATVAVCLPTFGDDVIDNNLSSGENDAERPGYCRIGDVYIKEGEQGAGPIGKCMRIKCKNATVGHKQFSAVGCSTFVPRPGCGVSDYDKTKRYPECCPREVCNGEVQD